MTHYLKNVLNEGQSRWGERFLELCQKHEEHAVKLRQFDITDLSSC